MSKEGREAISRVLIEYLDEGQPLTLIGQDGYTTIRNVGKKWQATTRRSEEGKTVTLYESLEEALEWFTCNVYAAGYRIKF